MARDLGLAVSAKAEDHSSIYYSLTIAPWGVVKVFDLALGTQGGENYRKLARGFPLESFQASQPSTGLLPFKYFAAPDGVLWTAPSAV